MLFDWISSIFRGLGGIDGDGNLVALDLMNNNETCEVIWSSWDQDHYDDDHHDQHEHNTVEILINTLNNEHCLHDNNDNATKLHQPRNCLVLFRHFGNASLFISWHMDVRHAFVDISCGSNELFFGTPQGDAKCFQKFYKQVGSQSGNLHWACFPK